MSTLYRVIVTHFVVETGVNDISNHINKDLPRQTELECKLALLKEIVLSISKPGMEIIVVKPIQRVDNKKNEKLGYLKGLGAALIDLEHRMATTMMPIMTSSRHRLVR